MRIEELGIAAGDKLQLQIGDNKEQRYPVIFIGVNPRGSLIVSAPISGEDKTIFVREGQMITLRFVAHNVASGFTTRVMVTRGQPYPYLHLEIPKEIQTVEVRNELRVSTDIAVTIINKTHKSPALTGRLLSLSCSGGRVESKMRLAHMDNVLNLTMQLKLEDIDCLVTFDCLVSYVKENAQDGIFTYGVKLAKVDKEEMIALRGFVYQELLRNMHMI